MILPDFLRSDEYGEIFLAGHRVTLYHLVKEYEQVHSTEKIVAAYPTLPTALVEKVIAFYHDHEPEVKHYVEETRSEIERQAALPARGPSLNGVETALRRKKTSGERVNRGHPLDKMRASRLPRLHMDSLNDHKALGYSR